MKKIIFLTVLVFCFVQVFAKNSKFSISNTFGGAENESGGSDLFVFSKTSQDDIFTNSSVLVSNRLSAKYKSDYIDSKMRLDFYTSQKDADTLLESLNLSFKGYAGFLPINFLGFYVGNSFFSKFALDGANLLALDDTPSYGKMLKSGFGVYSKIKVSDLFGIKFAVGLDSDFDFVDMDKLKLNAGLQLKFTNIATIGCTLQNLTGNKIKISTFASLNALEFFTFNIGYVYNNTDQDFLPQKTLHSIQTSLSYNFESINLPLSIYADLITALNNQYLKAGELRTYDGNYLPLLFTARIKYQVTPSLNMQFLAKYTGVLNQANSAFLQFHPWLDYTIKQDKDMLHAGVKIIMDAQYGRGINKITIPIYWKHNF